MRPHDNRPQDRYDDRTKTIVNESPDGSDAPPLVSETGVKGDVVSGVDGTRREILDTAHALLWRQPFRDVTVRDLMAATSVGRSSFYIYFQDRYDLARALLEEIDREIAAATPEIDARRPLTNELHANLSESVAVWRRHGPVIRAIEDASYQDASLEAIYRSWFIQRSIDRTARLVVDAQSDGRLPTDLDPAEVGTLMTLMAMAYMNDRLGRLPQACSDVVTEVLHAGFLAILGAPSA